MEARPLLVTMRWPDFWAKVCIMTVKALPLEQGMTMSSAGGEGGEVLGEDVGGEEAGAGVVDGLDEGEVLLDLAAEGEPVGRVGRGGGEEVFENGVGVGAEGEGGGGVSLGELGGVAVDVDDLAGGNELLPVEAGLLQAEAGAEGDEEVGLLHEDVGVAHGPRCWGGRSRGGGRRGRDPWRSR